MLEKTRSRPMHRIQKHLLAISEEERIVDEKYRKSYADAFCVASRNGIDMCGLPAVGCHVRTGEYAGGAQKPSDNLTLPMCSQCHRSQELYKGSQAEWFLENLLKPQLRRRYRRWQRGQITDPEILTEEQS